MALFAMHWLSSFTIVAPNINCIVPSPSLFNFNPVAFGRFLPEESHALRKLFKQSLDIFTCVYCFTCTSSLRPHVSSGDQSRPTTSTRGPFQP